MHSVIRGLKMSEAVNIFLREVFSKAVCSVQPTNLIKSHVKYDLNEDKLQVFTDHYSLNNKNVYLVGAGKAVLPMATEVENILGSRLTSGVVSVPMNILKQSSIHPNSVIKFYEGAENNLPDKKSELATKEIKSLVEKMDENSLLLVLLSGGGSALLASPAPPITLKEKSELISQLGKAGANIFELNTVRKKLSTLKGGKLAYLAYPATVVTLLISDIVGIHPDYVASGPTFENESSSSSAYEVVEKYSLLNSIPSSIKGVLCSKDAPPPIPWEDLQVSNYVLANNVSAIYVGYIEAKNQDYTAFELSHSVSGDVNEVAEDYCKLVVTIIKLLSKTTDAESARTVMESLKNVPLLDEILVDLPEVQLNNDSKGICLIAGGEPTVKVVGNGKGGRSQHLALKFSLLYNIQRLKHNELNNYDVYMLCAGTDGIDGPTDAAGAIGYSDLIRDASYQNLSVETYLANNNSYSFFSKLSKGKYHIKTGHTNTNVMDIHAILIKPKEIPTDI